MDLEAIFEAYRRLEGAAEVVIVEGIGGLLCPITDDFWVVHLARMIAPAGGDRRSGGAGHDQPHAADAARGPLGRIDVAGVVVNRYRLEPAAAKQLADPSQPYTRGDADMAIYTNPAQIAHRGDVEVLAIVPEEAANSIERATLGENTQFAIDQVDWERIVGLGH